MILALSGANLECWKRLGVVTSLGTVVLVHFGGTPEKMLELSKVI